MLTVNGSGFSSDARVTWNGISRATQVIDDGELQAQIYASDISTGADVTIQVNSGSPGSPTSAGVTLTVNNPAPTLRLTIPNAVAAQGSAFTMTVYGSNFTSTSIVEWNGSPRKTTFQATDQLTAAIDAADIASLQTASITVKNVAPGGGQSSAMYLPVYMLLNQTANDIVWDATNQVLYASVPNGAASHANTVLTLNPTTGAVLASKAAGNNPDVLALSGDDAYLYVGEDTSSAIQRFTLPGMTPDISWALGSTGTFGPNFALDIQVAPGATHTTAVSLGSPGVSSAAQGGVVIYDDSTPRATTAAGVSSGGKLYDSLQWGSTDSVLFGANYETSGGDFYVLSVSSSGVTLSSDVPGRVGVFQRQAIHFDASTGHIYDDGGGILSQSGAVLGLFKPTQIVPGPVAVDSSINRAFMTTDVGGGFSGFDIQSYDMTTQKTIGTIEFDGLPQFVSKMIRWGNDGLALLVSNATGGKQIMLIEGPFVH